MPSTSSMIEKLKHDFPSIDFVEGDTFRWSSVEQIVYYKDTDDIASLLHEVAHAALGHIDYTYDIELLQIEREAWNFTTSHLSRQYKVAIDQEEIEKMLDTYRDWLHSRSLCPSCQATGIQTGKKAYSCLSCRSDWHVNEARTCALRRYRK